MMQKTVKRTGVVFGTISLVIAAVVVSVLSLGCDTTNENTAGRDDSQQSGQMRPDTYGTGVQIELYERGRRTAEILSDTMVRYDKIDSTMARMIHVDAFDSTGRATGKLVGDSAVIRENTGLMDVFGHVVFIADDGTSLRTEYLRWSPETDQVETDSFVRIERDKDWATGWILRADRDLKRWRIEKDFQGTFFGAPLLDETP
ncbi:MAG: LPS export ABC transporter periplasmic protein LptC [bacterium]